MDSPIVYFSAEYGLSENFPIYAGGLGILAGDILREASDLSIPLVAVGLMYKKGFFRQGIDETGWQAEQNVNWDPEDSFEVVKDSHGRDLLVEIPFPSGNVVLKTWKRAIGNVSLYLLDADTPQNSSEIRELTSHLYTGDWNLHLEQEYILGVGGVRLIRALGIEPKLWHLNDDHAAISLIERLREYLAAGETLLESLTKVKEETLFTTHTPVKGAESLYDRETISPYLKVLLSGFEEHLEKIFSLGESEEKFSLSVYGINQSRFRNAVSKRHQEISQSLWKTDIDYVTNGINVCHWVSPSFDELYQKYFGEDWKSHADNPDLWQKIFEIPDLDLWQARLRAKQDLIEFLSEQKLWYGEIDPDDFFIGFARRFAPYKQSQVLISSMAHLKEILLDENHPAHLFISGKAHPIDKEGKGLLQKVYQADQDPEVGNYIIFCPNYEIPLAKKLVAGVDLWLNTPKPPMEASGTSGMKAIINGVLNASTLDGWWYEAYDGNNGWMVGSLNPEETAQMTIPEINDALYYLLEQEIIPLYYDRQEGVPINWLAKVRASIATCAPRFNTRRMLLEYKEKFYDRV